MMLMGSDEQDSIQRLICKHSFKSRLSENLDLGSRIVLGIRKGTTNVMRIVI